MFGMTYSSLDAFYAAHPRRHTGRERDFGLFWTGPDHRVYRAAWVEETGELYVHQHLATRGDGRVEVLRRFSRSELERQLRGWRDVIGRAGSFDWLVARVAA
jgi:hypothetical protein